MENCIFCRIVNGEIPSVKIWEDEQHIAILDNQPNVKGMALVLTKRHYDSYVFDMPRVAYKNFILATKKVAKLIEKGLKVQRVAMVMEGLGVNHSHIKLYPLYGLNEKFREILAPEKKYFEKYEGYITTQLGPQKSVEELEKIKQEILR